MTARLNTPIQGVARFNPECHESFDRSALFEIGYGKKRKKKHLSKICHFLPFSATLLNGKADESPAWTPKFDETRHAQRHCYQGVLAPCRVSAPKPRVV